MSFTPLYWEYSIYFTNFAFKSLSLILYGRDKRPEQTENRTRRKEENEQVACGRAGQEPLDCEQMVYQYKPTRFADPQPHCRYVGY